MFRLRSMERHKPDIDEARRAYHESRRLLGDQAFKNFEKLLKLVV